MHAAPRGRGPGCAEHGVPTPTAGPRLPAAPLDGCVPCAGKSLGFVRSFTRCRPDASSVLQGSPLLGPPRSPRPPPRAWWEVGLAPRRGSAAGASALVGGWAAALAAPPATPAPCLTRVSLLVAQSPGRPRWPGRLCTCCLLLPRREGSWCAGPGGAEAPRRRQVSRRLGRARVPLFSNKENPLRSEPCVRPQRLGDPALRAGGWRGGLAAPARGQPHGLLAAGGPEPSLQLLGGQGRWGPESPSCRDCPQDATGPRPSH